ncbi:MAG: hypothetical protein ACTSV2_00950 [Candidatus Thorarchaeota archaeon]
MSSDDDGKSDDYWMGVRDALRMVDSFHKWSKRNEDRAKSLEDFIHDGLIAAAKRCESCLSEELGIKFSPEEERDRAEASGPDIDLTTDGFDETVDVPITHEYKSEPSESDEIEPITIDVIDSSEGSISDDLIVKGEMRDFSSDFDLVEPSPLIITDSSDAPETLPSADLDEAPPIEHEPASDPSFTWKEYEREVTPEDTTEELPEAPAVDIERSKTWGSTDESIDNADEPVQEEPTDDPKPIETPPPPPPPPEPEESEEERKRRARRLFFGA